MFEKKSLVFYYCTTPLHVGAGTAVGAIDNPIQREVHSKHPIIAGSGLKGAIRHHVTRQWGEEKKNDIIALFGSETSSSDSTAGAISFTDANIIAFPVRSIKNTFVYVTCPYALARLKRMTTLAGLTDFEWGVNDFRENYGASEKSLKENGNDKCLYLEALEFKITVSNRITELANWISENCLSSNEENMFFKEKIKSDFFIISDDDFNFFVKQATVVEPHIKVDDDTGAVSEGNLFYTENLPPESILAGIVLASMERGNKENRMDAEKCLKKALWEDKLGISGQLIQMGGDSTTGRGLVLVNAVEGY